MPGGTGWEITWSRAVSTSGRCVRPHRVAASVRTDRLSSGGGRDSRLHDRRRRAGAVHQRPVPGGVCRDNGRAAPAPDAPAASGTVIAPATERDKLSLLSVNDVEDYWMAVYGESLKGTFRRSASWCPTIPTTQVVRSSYIDTYQLVNAFFSSRCNLITKDRGGLHGGRAEYFGDMSVNGGVWHTNSGILCK